MKFALPLISLLAATLPATAQVYQWKDSAGRTVISDTPPPGNASVSRNVGGEPTAGAKAAGQSLAEKDMEFRRRRLEAKEKAEREASERTLAAQRKDNCERARRQLAALEGGARMVTYDGNGERRVMEDAERQQEIERNRKIAADSCK